MESSSHNDAPVTGEAFGFKREYFIETLTEEIRTCTPPKGLAINGYWGSGKTSALMQIYQKLSGHHPASPPLAPSQRPHKEVLVIWFEAWRYQHEPQPIVALLHEIREQLGVWQRFRNATGKLTSVALRGAFEIFGEAIKSASGGLLGNPINTFQQHGEQWEAQHHHTPLPTKEIQQLLEQAIDQILSLTLNEWVEQLSEPPNPKNRLVIFIDDLDRCTPNAALRLLEGIKIYLNLKNCVLIFGMDQRQIEQALQQALYPNAAESREAAHQVREYLEKICQDIHHLPLPNREQKADYFTQLLTPLTKPKAAVQELEKYLILYDPLPANPRKIKAVVNRIALLLRRPGLLKSINGGKSFAALSKLPPSPPGEPLELHPHERQYCLLLAFSIIYCFHRLLHEQLLRNPNYINVLLAYAEKPDESSPTYAPMHEIRPSIKDDKELPVNPSDSNVFRLHQLLMNLNEITENDMKIAKEYLL